MEVDHARLDSRVNNDVNRFLIRLKLPERFVDFVDKEEEKEGEKQKEYALQGEAFRLLENLQHVLVSNAKATSSLEGLASRLVRISYYKMLLRLYPCAFGNEEHLVLVKITLFDGSKLGLDMNEALMVTKGCGEAYHTLKMAFQGAFLI